MSRLRAFIAVLVLCLAACGDPPTPRGTVAVVNGEAIPLAYVELIVDVTSQASREHDTLEGLRDNFARALSTAITLTLVRQEMAREREADCFDDLFADLESDLEGTDLEDYLLEAVIPGEEWKKLTAERETLDSFLRQFILPFVHVSLEEVREYYAEHKDRFVIAPNSRICFVATSDRSAVDRLCQSLSHADVLAAEVMCADVSNDEIPPDWQEWARAAKIGQCAEPREAEGLWQTIAVMERRDFLEVSPAGAYGLIERELLTRKVETLFEEWLEKTIASSDIRITPAAASSLADYGTDQADS